MALPDVIVAAALLAIVSAGLLSSLDLASAISDGTRNTVGASNIAHRELERMRQLPVDQLANYHRTAPVDGFGRSARYTVESEAIWMSDSADRPTCMGPAGGAPVDTSTYLKLAATVTWPRMGRKRPVVAETFVIPEADFNDGRGAARATIVDAESAPIPDVEVILTRPGWPTITAFTIADGGCAYFGHLLPGTYNFTIRKQGWTGPDGSPALTGTINVTAGTTVGGQATMVRAGEL